MNPQYPEMRKKGWIYGRHNQSIKTTNHNGHYIIEYKARSLPITFCNFKCLNISLFHGSAVFDTSISYQSQSIHTQPTITVDTKPLSIKRCLCHITFCNFKCLNISLFHSSAACNTLICYQSQSIHTAHNHSGHYTTQYKTLSVPHYIL
jgi:hypothetical protein